MNIYNNYLNLQIEDGLCPFSQALDQSGNVYVYQNILVRTCSVHDRFYCHVARALDKNLRHLQ